LARPGVHGTFSQPGPSRPTAAVRLALTLGRRNEILCGLRLPASHRRPLRRSGQRRDSARNRANHHRHASDRQRPRHQTKRSYRHAPRIRHLLVARTSHRVALGKRSSRARVPTCWLHGWLRPSHWKAAYAEIMVTALARLRPQDRELPHLWPACALLHSTHHLVHQAVGNPRCGLTPRWTTGPTTAGRLGPAWGTRYILPTRARLAPTLGLAKKQSLCATLQDSQCALGLASTHPAPRRSPWLWTHNNAAAGQSHAHFALCWPSEVSPPWSSQLCKQCCTASFRAQLHWSCFWQAFPESISSAATLISGTVEFQAAYSA